MKLIKYMVLIMVFAIFANTAMATIQIDATSYDPAVIASGDTVDIIVNFHDNSLMNDKEIVNMGDYKLHAWIEPSNTIAKNYITFIDVLKKTVDLWNVRLSTYFLLDNHLLFRGRYKAILMDVVTYLLELLRYN